MTSYLMPDDMLKRAARRLKMLSEPARLQILNQLQVHGEMCVQELVAATGQQQATISKHLGYLFQERIIKRRKDGQRVYYSIDDPSIGGICMLVCAGLQKSQSAES